MVKKSTLDLNRGSSLEKAAETLIKAADVAEMLNDTEMLLNIAAGWLEIFSRLDEQEAEKRPPIGFAKFPVNHVDPEPEEDTEVAAQVEGDTE